jgi:hypothetical protein
MGLECEMVHTKPLSFANQRKVVILVTSLLSLGGALGRISFRWGLGSELNVVPCSL